MENNNFELSVDYQKGVITGNFEELKTALEAKMKDYENVVYTVDTAKTAKKDIAELRKLKTALESKRKEIKKTWNDPYTDFENKVKELIAVIDKPIEEINSQIETFERQRIAEKKEKIEAAYKEIFAGIEEYASLDKIYDPKWENSTTSMKSIRERMVTLQTAVSNSISTIKNMKSDAVEDALKIYKNTGDLATALAHITQYENQKAEILEKQRLEEQERQRKSEEERIRKEEQAKLEAERKAEEERKQAKKRNEEMAKKMLEEKQQYNPVSDNVAFNSNEPQGFSVHTGFQQATQSFDCGFTAYQQEPQGFESHEQQKGFNVALQPTGFGIQSEQATGFTVSQQEVPRTVTFTVRTNSEDADRLEAMLNTWGFTDFDRR